MRSSTLRSDVAFWQPHLQRILERHGLDDAGQLPDVGYNSSYPTFVYGEFVVKLFGQAPNWRTGFWAEQGALRLVGSDPRILAPRLLASGALFPDDVEAAWPYLVTSLMPGVPWWRANLTLQEQQRVARELGAQLRLVHALPPVGVATDADWAGVDVTEGARRSSLPAHLVAQAAAYVAQLGPPERVFLHGDLVANHTYVADGRLVGIIDWGDALVSDRHYELGQIHRDIFDCDTALLRAFLQGYDWPVGPDFPHLALGHALRRQAIGLVQHVSIDLFEPIAAKFPLHDIATLAELAQLVFGVDP